MKIFTKYFIYYSLICLALVNLFNWGLTYIFVNGLEAYYNAILGTVYGITMFFAGFYFGKKDYIENEIFDIGIRFHTITYILCNTTSILWAILIIKFDNLKPIYMSTIWWGFGLILHYVAFIITRKNSIKGYDKNDIFE